MTTNQDATAPKSILIADRPVGPDHPPFIVAELSANHGGDLQRAHRIIEAAASAGADAIKFQAYTADSLTLDMALPDFQVAKNSPWAGRQLYELYQEAATPYEWFPELFEACREANVIPFASPFDRAAVDMLRTLDAPAYKIASFEAVDLDLIAACAETGKPLIISVGLCNEEEISDALNAATQAGAKDVILLQCNSAYPSDDKDANLLTLPHLHQQHGVLVGFSDHTLGTSTAAAACALGACIIEKHVIDQTHPPTVDSAFSLTPETLKKLVDDCRTAWRCRGEVRHGPTESERGSLAFRRSLYVVQDMKPGDTFTPDTIKSIRPGNGLPPKYLKDIVGRQSARDLAKGEALDWSMISETGEDDA